MTTLTMLASSSATVGTTSTTFNEDGTIDTEKRNTLIGSSAILGGTIIGSSMLEDNTMNEIYEKYSSSYIDSMSDEELVSALEQLDLLERNIEKSSSKSI